MPTISGFKMVNGKISSETENALVNAGLKINSIQAINWKSDRHANLVPKAELKK